MSEEERIIFSKYFYIREDNQNNMINFYDMALGILINSKEIRDSSLKISEKCYKSEMLGLVVSPDSLSSYSCRFSMMYSMDDGDIHENRTMDGVISFSIHNGVKLIGNINRFNESGLIGTCELTEIFLNKGINYVDFFSYGGTPYCGKEYISNSDFNNLEEFKSDVVKLMKNR